MSTSIYGKYRSYQDHTSDITSTQSIHHGLLTADHDYAHRPWTLRLQHPQCPHPTPQWHPSELPPPLCPLLSSNWAEGPPLQPLLSGWCNGHLSWAMLEWVQPVVGQGAASRMWSYCKDQFLHCTISWDYIQGLEQINTPQILWDCWVVVTHIPDPGTCRCNSEGHI